MVSGHGLIQERRVGSDEVLEFEVTGDKPQAIHMLPGYIMPARGRVQPPQSSRADMESAPAM